MGLKNSLIETFKGMTFSLSDAYEKFASHYPKEQIRARIYESLGVAFKRIGKGIYFANTDAESVALIEGDGRDLSILKDCSVDCIITDHPWADTKSNKGGNRSFADYEAFRYTVEDFKEKARVLKDGCFLVEFLPAENESNFNYLYEIKKMAEEAGFLYYSKVAWKKGTFVSNTGRKSKNTEDVMIFTKGKCRAMRPDVKKDLADPTVKHYMSGSAEMLPTCFDVQPPAKKERLHQAEKPVGLMEQLLKLLAFEGEIVLDQFAGSGVVGEACMKTNRLCILFEKAREFVDKISERLQLKGAVAI